MEGHESFDHDPGIQGIPDSKADIRQPEHSMRTRSIAIVPDATKRRLFSSLWCKQVAWHWQPRLVSPKLYAAIQKAADFTLQCPSTSLVAL